MKTILRFAFAMIAISFFQFSDAQITKLSGNTDLIGMVVNNRPVFLSSQDNTLWTSDGTPSGTVKYTTKVFGDFIGNGGYGIAGGKLYFSGVDAAHGSELWVTDGTDAGTSLIKDIVPGSGSSSPTRFFPFNNIVFFFTQAAGGDYELWKTDGTIGGAVMVKDIVAVDDGSIGHDFFSNNGVVYFTANDGVHGNELWKTDGTNGGTKMVKDINPEGNGLGDDVKFIALGTLTLFAARVGDDGPDPTSPTLWKTDGTEAGTVELGYDVIEPVNFVAFNNKICFGAYSVDAGKELWVTDGTAAGTNVVKDINPGVGSSFIELDNSIIFGNHLVFTATDSVNIGHLWSTDGTTEGTVLLKGSNSGDSISYISLLPAYNSYNSYNSYSYSDLSFSNIHTPPYNGKAFISVYSTAQQSAQLWITDGTAAGTVLVKDGSAPYSDGHDYFYTANGLFFTRQYHRDSYIVVMELWRSDGTAAGTGLVEAVNSDAGRHATPYLSFDFAYNNQLYFTYGADHYGAIDLFIVDENVTLPISLYNFAATALPSKAVNLEWNTTNELNSSHFDIERSTDGINFGKIDKVNAAGNSGITRRYNYTDLQPAHLRNPVLFYRLKMIDKDAAFKYSGILAVHFNQSSFEFSISPNPVQNQLSVVVAAPGAKSAALRVTNASGKQVYQQTLSASQTINQQNINVSGWQKSIYYIQLITDKSVKSAKFIKQ